MFFNYCAAYVLKQSNSCKVFGHLCFPPWKLKSTYLKVLKYIFKPTTPPFMVRAFRNFQTSRMMCSHWAVWQQSSQITCSVILWITHPWMTVQTMETCYVLLEHGRSDTYSDQCAFQERKALLQFWFFSEILLCLLLIEQAHHGYL